MGIAIVVGLLVFWGVFVLPLAFVESDWRGEAEDHIL